MRLFQFIDLITRAKRGPQRVCRSRFQHWFSSDLALKGCDAHDSWIPDSIATYALRIEDVPQIDVSLKAFQVCRMAPSNDVATIDAHFDLLQQRLEVFFEIKRTKQQLLEKTKQLRLHQQLMAANRDLELLVNQYSRALSTAYTHYNQSAAPPPEKSADLLKEGYLYPLHKRFDASKRVLMSKSRNYIPFGFTRREIETTRRKWWLTWPVYNHKMVKTGFN